MMQTSPIPLCILPHGKGLELPAYMTVDAVAMDLRAALTPDTPRLLNPGERTLIPTGLTMALPTGVEAQIRPRSGLALKHGITVLNAPGTIDSDYRGEIGVILVHLGLQEESPFEIRRGERIAQMIFAPVMRGAWRRVEHLPETQRGAGGFGHTGI